MKIALMNFLTTMSLIAALITGCGKGNAPEEKSTSAKLELVAVSEHSLTFDVTVESSETVNFAYLQTTCVSTGEGKTVMLPDSPLGTNRIDVTGLAVGEEYETVAFVNIAGGDEVVRSESVKVKTGKPVEVEIISRAGTDMVVKLGINIPAKPVVKGITWKKKSDAQTDPTIILLEDGKNSCTISGIDQYSTYLLQGFADFGSGYVWSDALSVVAPAPDIDGDWQLVFSAEFNEDNEDLTKVWTFEEGSKIRNNENQFYSRSKENAFTKDGCLHIVARRNHLGSDGKTHDYTSASMTTEKSFRYCYGRVEVRAKIPTGGGMWPAIWQVGNLYTWPQNGELDIMEYYREKILANVAFGGTANYSPTWRSSSHPMSKFESKNPNWRQEFHTWVLEWDYDWIRIYLDDDLLNEVAVKDTFNKGVGGNYENPYRYNREGFGHHLWLNLAIGGNNGGTIDNSLFPAEYLVDYVRVYQKERLPK